MRRLRRRRNEGHQSPLRGVATGRLRRSNRSVTVKSPFDTPSNSSADISHAPRRCLISSFSRISAITTTWGARNGYDQLRNVGAIERLQANGVDAEPYMADVMARIQNDWPASRWDELMPWNGSPPADAAVAIAACSRSGHQGAVTHRLPIKLRMIVYTRNPSCKSGRGGPLAPL